MKPFNVKDFNIKKFDAILSRGLCYGMGHPNKQMCIEAAICATLGLPHGDDPKCVAKSVRAFKIRLNDSRWSTPTSRAMGLRDLGLAQLGSLGVIHDVKFSRTLAKKTIRVIIPMLFRDVFPKNKKCLKAADACERDGSSAAAYAADAAAAAAYAATAAAYAATAATAAAYAATAAAYAATSATAAAYAADAADAATAAAVAAGDKYLIRAAEIATQILREMGSPGCQLL